MLNAFRHQRFFHLRLAPSDAPDFARCSTPFGIKGSFTAGSRTACALRAPVLNAFRHQRFFHDWIQSHCTASSKCSTPFGIKGSFTASMGQAMIEVLLCSTPFGIKGSFTLFLQPLLRGVRSRCSTPFGIKGSFTDRNPPCL